jgi:hypothetical protein
LHQTGHESRRRCKGAGNLKEVKCVVNPAHTEPVHGQVVATPFPRPAANKC